MPLAPRLTALLREDSHLAWVLPILGRLSQSSGAVLNELEQVLEENPYDVGLAAVVLKLRRTPRNVERFVRYLSSPQRAVQVMALEKIGEKCLAVPEIANQVASILDRPEVMESAGKDSWSDDDLFPPTLKALEGLGQEAAPAGRRLKEIKATGSPPARLWAARVLYQIEGRAAGVLPLALELLGKRKREAWTDAIRLAGSIGPAAREAEASLRAALKIPSTTIRPAAACALWRITGNHSEALAVLLEGLERPLMGFQEEPEWLLLQFGEDREPDDQILAEMGRPALEALLPLLRHTLSEVRIAACYAIGSMGRQALPGVPDLCDSLRDPHFRVAGAAMKAIEKLRPEDLLPLEELLRDGDARVVLRAASLLAKLRRVEAVPMLEGLLDRDDTRAGADFLIGTIDPSRRGRAQVPRNRMPPETVETLLSRLSERDAVVARRAAEALGKLGPRAAPAVPVLAQALDRDLASLEHIRALGRIRSNAPKAVPALLRALRGKADSTSSQHRLAEEALLAFGSEAVPYVIDELRDAQQKSRRSKLQISWFRVLESCGPDAAPAIPLLIAELGREYYWYRELAAKALGAIGPAAHEAVPQLEKILDDPKEFASVLDAAYRALKRIRPVH